MDGLLERLLDSAKTLAPLDAPEIRANFEPEHREFFSQHLLKVQNKMNKDFGSIVEEIAWRYGQLVSWGEPSAAKVLAEEYKVSIRTIHSRLRLARERKLINKPGSGERLSTKYESNMKKVLE